MMSLSHGGSPPELLIGLSYNPPTGRLCVEVIKGSHFRNLAMSKAPGTVKFILFVNRILSFTKFSFCTVQTPLLSWRYLIRHARKCHIAKLQFGEGSLIPFIRKHFIFRSDRNIYYSVYGFNYYHLSYLSSHISGFHKNIG